MCATFPQRQFAEGLLGVWHITCVIASLIHAAILQDGHGYLPFTDEKTAQRKQLACLRPHLSETIFYLMTVARVQALFILPHHLSLLRLELDNNLQDAGHWVGGNESESPSLCCPECLIDPVMLLLLEGKMGNFIFKRV